MKKTVVCKQQLKFVSNLQIHTTLSVTVYKTGPLSFSSKFFSIFSLIF